MRSPQQFTENKATARKLQRETIEAYLSAKAGQLRYFGLPSSSLIDAGQWQDLFRHFVAVERGEAGHEWELQHDLELTAFRTGLFDRVTLLRGEIDSIIHKKKDVSGNKLRFPFDVISLDYSGGLFYRDAKNTFVRLRAIEEVIHAQAKSKMNFVLLISCNLDHIDQGEVRKTLETVRTELVRYGIVADEVVDAYLKGSADEPRLKIYLPFFVNLQSAKHHYNCATQPVIVYEGNLATKMMAFRFFLSYDERTASLRPPRERLSQLFNSPVLQIVKGQPQATMLGMPKLTAPDR